MTTVAGQRMECAVLFLEVSDVFLDVSYVMRKII